MVIHGFHTCKIIKLNSSIQNSSYVNQKTKVEGELKLVTLDVDAAVLEARNAEESAKLALIHAASLAEDLKKEHDQSAQGCKH